MTQISITSATPRTPGIGLYYVDTEAHQLVLDREDEINIRLDGVDRSVSVEYLIQCLNAYHHPYRQ